MSENKKPNHLDEVRLAAQYNFFKHKREQEEDQRRKEAVREGTLEELVAEEMALSQKATQPAPSKKGE
jgi:hypothetical protein